MLISELLALWVNDRKFSSLLERLKTDPAYRVEYHGLDGSGRNYFLSALAGYSGKKILLLTADQAKAEKAYADIDVFLPGSVRLLPSRELFVNSEVISRSEEIQHQRLQFLQWLTSSSGGIFVAPVAALLSKNLPPETWHKLTIKLDLGSRINREQLITDLVERGYERSSLTETVGQFSARGAIIDLFSPGLGRPLRLELNDDLIESIRYFDPLSQRSSERHSSLLLMPARELIILPADYLQGEKRIRENLEKSLSRLRKRGDTETAVKLRQMVGDHLERLSHPEGLDLLSSYFDYFYSHGASLLDYLPEGSLLALEEADLVIQKADHLKKDLDKHDQESYAQGELLGRTTEQLWGIEDIFTRYEGPVISLNALSGSPGFLRTGESYSLEVKSAPLYHGQWGIFENDLHYWHKEHYQVFLAAGSEERSNNLSALIREQLSDSLTYTSLAGVPDEGFIIPSLQLAVITEQNLLPKRKKKKRISKREGTLLSSYSELAVGDYVVHEQHGIGQFQGVHTLSVAGIERDYLQLKYRGTDKLYIPIDQVRQIRRYSGGAGTAPHLHSLGGSEWRRLKRKVNQSVEDLARDLLQLYAARQAITGYSFGPDHPWQQEFEAQFPYEETPDQLQAIADVKEDLEKNHPMDRLICGDVGYGKTEVAMRAAFKVVMEGKQVVILVPTTVLAQQHFRTFRERFNGFPVQVAQLSRFVPPLKQKEIIKNLAAGKIDLVIGTHRLLAKDLRLPDLGLLVIDEEQRFGVKQKEKIKKMRLEVDTLSMTATPIPRTLHLSLAGARDLSIIDTPPEDRYPVQTYVLEYSENLVCEAVQRELDRQGQVFIVFNRVAQIEAFADKIAKLFPSASVAVGHGQMPEVKLEKVMSDFQEGYYQILVSSTIIESGLDIPNVNTLIVCDADRFGLAQLYQIRGRVGRSNRLAYAYLTYQKDKLISETARKRLKAIREFTELGSGFKIALRDLEIRGAGNILGAEQHGFIAAVGFDLYVRMLDQAVALLKNEPPETRIEPSLDLKISAYIPSSYIPAQDQKIDFYQKIYSAGSLDELADIEDEMIDRFATPPDPVRKLLQVARIRIRAADAGIVLISHSKNGILLRFSASSRIDLASVERHRAFAEKRAVISGKNPLSFKLLSPRPGLSPLDSLLLDIEELEALRVFSEGF